MLIGREKEKMLLEKLYASNSFNMVTITGQRGMGKTALIRDFVQNKSVIFFTAMHGSESTNLEYLSKSIQYYYRNESEEQPYSSFDTALEEVFALSEQRHLVLVIDEYQYLEQSAPGFVKILYNTLACYQSCSKLLLILGGHSIPFLETTDVTVNYLLSKQLTAQLKLKPLNFVETVNFLVKQKGGDTFSPLEYMKLYAIFGGNPAYLSKVDGAYTFKENMMRLVFSKEYCLRDEIELIMNRHLKLIEPYFSVLLGMGKGISVMADISAFIGCPSSGSSDYLRRLISLEIIKKTAPGTRNKLKRSRYVFDNHLFHFYFTFIPRNLSHIMLGETELAYFDWAENSSEFVHATFIELCKIYLQRKFTRKNGKKDIVEFFDCWGFTRPSRKEISMDIAAVINDEMVLGECRLSRNNGNAGGVESLMAKSRQLNVKCKQFYIFSNQSFSHEALLLSKVYKKEGITIHMVTLEEVMEANLFQ